MLLLLLFFQPDMEKIISLYLIRKHQQYVNTLYMAFKFKSINLLIKNYQLIKLNSITQNSLVCCIHVYLIWDYWKEHQYCKCRQSCLFWDCSGPVRLALSCHYVLCAMSCHGSLASATPSGTFTSHPSISLVTITWQPRRDL